MTDINLHTVWKACTKIKFAIQKGFDLWEYIRPLDPEGKFYITQTQFYALFGTRVKDITGLSEVEIEGLSDYFCDSSHNILYRQLFDLVYEQDPFEHTKDPPIKHRWADLEKCPVLNIIEQRRLNQAMEFIARTLINRKIDLQPDFKHYEKTMQGFGAVSQEYLSKIFYSKGIHIDKMSYDLIFKKYNFGYLFVNYNSFLEDLETLKHEIMQTSSCTYDPIQQRVLSHEELKQTLQRLQKFVYAERVNLPYFFRKLDTRNSGKLSKDLFRVGLTSATANANRFVLDESEVDAIIKLYTDPNFPELVLWKLFESDISSVFDVQNVLQTTTKLSDLPENVLGIKLSKGDHWNKISLELRNKCEESLRNVREHLDIHSMDMTSFFHEHDKHGTGRVSSSQLRQVFTLAGIHLENDDINALELRYTDEYGFVYLNFLKEVYPTPEKGPLREQAKSVKPAESQNIIGLLAPNVTLDGLIRKIRVIMRRYKHNILVYFLRYDPLQTSLISRRDFVIVLTEMDLRLTDHEISLIFDEFSSCLNKDQIEYLRLCEAINDVGDVKIYDPTGVQYRSNITPHNSSKLTFAERRLLGGIIQKLSKRMSLKDKFIFKDKDKFNCGHIPVESFLSCLNNFNLLWDLSKHEKEVMLKGFEQSYGPVREIDYLSFLRVMDSLALW